MANYTSSDVQVYTETLGLVLGATPVIKESATAGFPNIEYTAPVAAVNTPTAGSTLASKSTALVVDVTDASSLKRVIIFASFSAGANPEMVYDGTNWTSAYDASSARSSISGGYRYSIVRDAGWRTNPTIYVYALDDAYPAVKAKNELNFTSFSWVFTPDSADPAIAANSPAENSTLASADVEISLDITDASAIGTTIIIASYGDGGPEEVVFDGTDFADGYSGSTSGISGGTRYSFTRDDGWRKDPTFSHYAADELGNEALP